MLMTPSSLKAAIRLWPKSSAASAPCRFVTQDLKAAKALLDDLNQRVGRLIASVVAAVK
jgi:hypothetical protein